MKEIFDTFRYYSYSKLFVITVVYNHFILGNDNLGSGNGNGNFGDNFGNNQTGNGQDNGRGWEQFDWKIARDILGIGGK